MNWVCPATYATRLGDGTNLLLGRRAVPRSIHCLARRLAIFTEQGALPPAATYEH